MSGTGSLTVPPAGSLAPGSLAPGSLASGSLAHGGLASAWLTALVSFVIVIALILLSRHGLKFLEPYLLKGRRTRSLALVESLALDQRRRLSLIRCGGRSGLILTGGGNDLFLGWIGADDDTRPSPEDAKEESGA